MTTTSLNDTTYDYTRYSITSHTTYNDYLRKTTLNYTIYDLYDY